MTFAPLLLAALAGPTVGPSLPVLLATRQEGASKSLVDLPADYVRFVRLPEGGTQPRLRRTQDGTTVVLFYRGGETAGDLFLVRSEDEGVTFGPAVQVNPTAGTVPRAGGLHLAALGLGIDGRAVVVWVQGGDERRLMLARETGDGSVETQDLGTAPGMALGSAVAIDDAGVTYVFHGAGDPSAESTPDTGWKGRVWMRKAAPGAAFGEPSPAGRPLGVSLECPMDAVFDPWSRTVYAVYRSYWAPREGTKVRSRDLMLLSTEDGGATFKTKLTDNWRHQPELTALAKLDLEPYQQTVRASWEGRGTVYAAVIRRNFNTVALALEPRDGDGLWRSSTSSATGKHDDALLCWVERPADDSEAPPSLRWRVFDRERRAPIGGDVGPPSGGSVPAALARDAGGYTVLY